MRDRNKSFTLIELMLVIVLLSILALFLSVSFNKTLQRGRDQQRKNDLSQLQKTLEVYYEDNGTYPIFVDIFNIKLCTTSSCLANDTVYMIKTPKDPSSSYVYKYEPEPTPAGGGSSSYFYLYSYIENDLDQGSGVSTTGYTNDELCDALASSVKCRYYVSSSNAPLLTPNP